MEDETPDHLFVNCGYLRKLWLPFKAKTGDTLWIILGRPVSVAGDLRVGDIIEGI